MKAFFKRLLKDFHEGGEINFLFGFFTATLILWLETR